jgi:hypothetical protein
VLQLVCKACGKPCRSETEKQLHTTRNPGHTEFVDQTAGAGPVDYTIKKEGADLRAHLGWSAALCLLPAPFPLSNTHAYSSAVDIGMADPMDLDDDTRAAIAAATGKDPAAIAKAAAAKGCAILL